MNEWQKDPLCCCKVQKWLLRSIKIFVFRQSLLWTEEQNQNNDNSLKWINPKLSNNQDLKGNCTPP